jgi:3-methyladenine DNA glycosylase AlkD
MLNKLKSDLKKLSKPDKTKIYQRFFKTGKGEYGEGDVFLGLNSQQIKDVAKKYFKEINLLEIQELLNSKIHEHRMCALRMLVYKYESIPDLRYPKSGMTKKQIFNFYIKNAKKINNWDLVDVSCPRIVGVYLLDNNPSTSSGPSGRKILYKLAKSKNLWERRIAIVSTWWFIRENQFKDTIKISEILLTDKHDLIHKACGWMLREVGKRDKKVLIKFLNQHAGQMPRTILRYAIEKFNEKERKFYLNK